MSRLQKILAERRQPDLPPLSEAAQPLATWLFEAGPIQLGGMAAAPLSWVELQAWQQQAGIALQPWQAVLLRRLSSEYLRESKAAEAPDALSPVVTAATAQVRASVARRIGLEFGSLAAAQRASKQRGARA